MISKRTASAKRFFSCQSAPKVQRQTKDQAIAVAAEVALEASSHKLTETLLEIVHPVKLDAFPNPYDNLYDEDLLVERRDTTELGELRRRLFIAERAGCGKLAEMWRRQIQERQEEEKR